MIDPVFLQRYSQSVGMDRYSVLREFLQINFLQALYSQNGSSQFVFKGGTALRFLLPSNRYSEDLDFTTNLSQTDIFNFTQKTIESLDSQFPNISLVNLKTLTGISQKIHYLTNISPQPLTIKLDFSQRESVFYTQKGSLKFDLPITSTVAVTYLDFPEILAEKWRAITSRQKGRDIYDFWYLLHRNIQFNQDLIQKKLDYYQDSYDPQKLLDKIKNFDDEQLETDVRRFLPERDRSIIPILKKELLQKLSILFNKIP